MQGLCLKYAKAAPAASGEASQPRFAVGLHAGVTPYPLNCQYERIDLRRLIALALYRMASATSEADETHPQ